MKKITKIVALTATLMTFLFTSCNNLSTGSSVSGDFKQNIASFEIIAMADSNLVDFSSSTIDLSSDSETAKSIAARTIAPTALDGTSGLKFYLGGLNKGTSEKVFATNVTFISEGGSTTKGKVTVDLEPSNYSFTLVALLEADATAAGITSTTEVSSLLNKAVLVGYANADLRYPKEAAKVNFYLSSDGLTGTGSVDFKFYLDNWSDSSKNQKIGGEGANKDNNVISNATIKLTNYRTNALITGTDYTGVNFTNKEAATEDSTQNYNPSTINALGSLQAGTYNLVVSFTKDGRTYSYSDDVKVLPGQTTSATIAIPDLLVGAPEAPEKFVQTYAEPAASDSDNYYVYFTWEDKSKTEQYFEVQLFDITATTIPVNATNDKTTWTDSTSSNTYSYTTDFYGLKDTSKPSWYAGSLQKNNKFAGFYMPLGKRYLARIRAVSEAGESSWVYAQNPTKASESDTDPITVSISIPVSEVTAEDVKLGETKTLTGKKFATNIINLYRISYMPNGGAFDSAQQTVFYFSQTQDRTAIMCPDGTYDNHAPYVEPTGKISLKQGKIFWTNWKINQTSGKTYPSKFEKPSASADFDATKLYYVTATLDTPDINGSTAYYTIASVQPTTKDNAAELFYNTGIPVEYKGFSNLILYANYTKNTFGVQIDNPHDNLFSENYNVTVAGSGTGSSLPIIISNKNENSGSCLIQRTGDNGSTTTMAKWTFATKENAKVSYSKITGELFEMGTNAGDVSKGCYTASSNQIDMGLTTLTAGKYKLIFNGYVGASVQPYTYTVYITLTD